jgi:hypothetical protein
MDTARLKKAVGGSFSEQLNAIRLFNGNLQKL